MATIRKLPSGKHNVQVRREGQAPLSATFTTAAEAKAWARKIESDIDTGKHYGDRKLFHFTSDVVDSGREKLTAEKIKGHTAAWRGIAPRRPSETT